MADTTSLFGFFHWSASDKLPLTVSQISSNFDKLEDILTRRGVDVKFLGAKGDYNLTTKTGTDDSKAFQRALDLAIDPQDSVTLFIPTGTYRMAQELKIYSNTTIICAPNVRIIRDHSKYLMMNGNRSTEPNPSNYTGYNGRGNIHIIGGIWDGNGVNQTSKASIFHLGHGDNITFQGMTLMDVSTSHHVEFNACRNIRVDKCKFLGMANLDTTGETFNECIQLDLSKGSVTTIGSGDNTPCKDVWITDCYFGNSDTVGSGAIGRAVGSHTSTTGRQHENVNIDNCTVENARTWAFRVYNYKRVSITNNKIINCAQGINWRASITGADTTDSNGNQVGAEVTEGGVISGNVFTGGMTGGRAIEIYGESGTSGRVKGIVVKDNSMVISSSISDAINFHYAEHCVCEGNRIYGAGNNAIEINTDCIDILVQGNTIDNSTDDGVEVTDSSYVTIVGNNIRRSGDNGVYVSAGEGFVIANNSIIGVNGNNNATVDDFNHIRFVSGAKKATVTGNVCRAYSTTHVGTYALYVTNSCYDITDMGNSAMGYNWYNGSLLSANNVKDALGNIHK
ncbi:right-handed parallel beta-helix repeat-containing protein [Bacillus sporothermodurans]|uniref:glycosyl hydrolase family 28-related protein n=1 Tax=Heyndrickxia sporothermodurans TaxID=46224 RepID=UPI00192B1C42|nr:glycosyl hydrolase family 28-related protein [Heyndrickxia sporothermodurans]MBL5776988.1 right-handed parallel beta-helix repeat-containing protein [Heyndrickxia sporothermodurans]MBL5798515.1 right-handed parallel beta-helix repeat-containing protein [Heyndrickxia sporothermodurans]MBL5809432.1 right-handed parallel beta-helix repeat-containing protein [Heyndrickxia sporothermodurans]MBL5813067.1 right-handed parallel beta-helix repeat-containing protein [Heyndrickxia sporothermodurans]MB